MAFVVGPRQVGKTTTCQALAAGGRYLNWDDPVAARIVAGGADAVARELGLEQLRAAPLPVVFDEIHKHRRCKAFLKGFFDRHGAQVRTLVTGSSRLDAWRRGGDSLMGRYFLYRMHPFTVGELVAPRLPEAAPRPPIALADADWQALWEHGGYPEPFVRRATRFSNRWRELRMQQLVREEVRDVTAIQDVSVLDLLARLLVERSAEALVYSSFAKELRVTVDTVRRWVATLASLHLGFLVRPWPKNVTKSLRKEPKWYAADWSAVGDPGRRAETFVACHLLKSVEGWQDAGFGRFELRYLRDKEKREVDFLVVRDGKPWFLVEAKLSDTALSRPLAHFQRQTKADHAFQVVVEADYVAADCFARRDPCVVPARTLFAQLL
ncbi:MAG: ATP-binding protein [Planctomycetes bacterium]|nr:ATP-binding protein [Planctomycetota bacterium]